MVGLVLPGRVLSITLRRSSCAIISGRKSYSTFLPTPVLLHQKAFKMSGLERLQKNAKIAEDLIAEISAKIQSIAPNGNVETVKSSTDELKKEVAKWTEILTMVEIRKGLDPTFYLQYLTPEGEALAEPTKAEVQDNTNVAQPTKPEVAGGNQNKESKGKKNQEKATKPDENLNVAEKKPAQEGQQQEGGGKKQKNKAPAKPKEASGSAPAAAEVVDVSRLDLRIGKIVEVDRHPEADSLYLEKIDVGEANPRTVISGLVKHIPLEEMRDRMVVLLCNLKPAKMRGITSEAMVMCASTPDKVEVLSPPAGAVPGDVVEFEGFTRNPDPVLNPKKKIFETVAPDLKTNDAKVATYKGVPFTVPGKGQVVAQTLANVNIK